MASNGHSKPYERQNVGRPPFGREKLPEMQVITDAKTLQRHTYKKVRNLKIFPKKDRMLSDQMFRESCNIAADLMTANDCMLNVPEERQKRFQMQRSALRNCRLLINDIELSHELLSGLDDKAFSYWTKLASDVKNQAAAWYRRDRERARNMDAASK